MNPKKELDKRVRHSREGNFSKKDLKYPVASTDSLKTIEQMEAISPKSNPRSCQGLISEFFWLFKSGQVEHLLADYTPTAQAHLINEIKIGITLIEEFVSKNNSPRVTTN